MRSQPPPAPSLVTLTASTAGLLVGAQVASKASRDALFLGTFDAAWLPWAMLGSAATSLLGVVVFSRLMRALGPGRVLPGACLFSAVLFLAEWSLVGTHPQPTAWLLYLHVAALGAVLVSGFWSTFSELFNPSDARRFVAKIGAGGTLGGIVGGLLVERVAVSFSVPLTLPLLAALHLLAAGLMSRLTTRPVSAEREAPGRGSGLEGLRLIHQDRNLRWIGVFVALLAITAALADFSFKATVSQRGEERELMTVFAFYYVAVSLLTFLVQSLLTDRSLSRFGLAGTLALLPGAFVVLSFLAATLPGVGTAAALRGTGAILENSMHRSSYELLYTPLSKKKRRATKTFLDVGAPRLGDALGGLLVLCCVAWLPAAAPRAATVLAVCAASLGLALVWRLHRGYVTALAESLRNGVVEADSLQVRDATTLRTIADTTMKLDRDRLLLEIERFRARERSAPNAGVDEVAGDSSLTNPASPSLVGHAESPAEHRRVELGQWLPLLLADSPDGFRARAEKHDVPPELAAVLVSRLGERSWERTASGVLRELTPRIDGLLEDVLLDEDQPATVRRRIPDLLRHRPHRRGVQCLLRGLRAARFDVRVRCAQSLVGIQQTEPQLVRPQITEVHELVVQELQRDAEGDGGSQSLWPEGTHDSCRDAGDSGSWSGAEPGTQRADGEDSQFPPSAEAEWIQSLRARRLQRRVEQAFLLLSLVHERGPLALCLTALSGEDGEARGTALEYLENVLPQEVRLALEPHLDPSR